MKFRFKFSLAEFKKLDRSEVNKLLGLAKHVQTEAPASQARKASPKKSAPKMKKVVGE